MTELDIPTFPSSDKPKPRLSIIFPSKRKECAEAVIQSIKLSAINHAIKDDEYEILVCAPFELEGATVIPEPEQFHTIAELYNLLYRNSKGRFIFVTGDSFVVEANFFLLFLMMDLMESVRSVFMPIFALEHRGHPHYPINPEGYPILGCPIILRDYIEEQLNGKIFNENLLYHYMDCWLTFYVGETFGKPGAIISTTGLHRIRHGDNNGSDEIDAITYARLKEEFRQGNRQYA